MKIISKFHDYYDSAQGYGFDPNLVYKRQVRKVNLPFPPPQFEEIRRIIAFDDPIPSYVSILGFCGRIYPLLIDNSIILEEWLSTETSMTITQPRDEFVKSFTISMTKYARHRPHEVADMRRWANDLYGELDSHSGEKLDDAVFIQLDAPIFVCQANSFFTNPRLATLGFSSRFEAFTAYQEISLYLGSVLASKPIAPLTVGDDKTVAQSKGFDEQSFRTPSPGNKKINRKRNKEKRSDK